jgi:hypothetical protein
VRAAAQQVRLRPREHLAVLIRCRPVLRSAVAVPHFSTAQSLVRKRLFAKRGVSPARQLGEVESGREAQHPSLLVPVQRKGRCRQQALAPEFGRLATLGHALLDGRGKEQVNGRPVVLVNHPIRYDDQIPELPVKGITIGEHTREILAEHGYTPARIGGLLAGRVVGGPSNANSDGAKAASGAVTA